jgi:hypothetical protein
VETLIDVLPVFYKMGISRKQLLSMPHWEVMNALAGHYKHRARDILDMTDAVALGSGFGEPEEKENARNMIVGRAGFPRIKTKVPKKFTGKSWTSDLMGAI